MAYLETGGTPVDEFHRFHGLHLADGHVDVFGHDVAAVEQAHGHVLAVHRVAFHLNETDSHAQSSSMGSGVHGFWDGAHHLRALLEAGLGDVGHAVLFVHHFVFADDGRKRGQREVDARIGHQIRLEFVQVHVQRAFEAQRHGNAVDEIVLIFIPLFLFGDRVPITLIISLRKSKFEKRCCLKMESMLSTYIIDRYDWDRRCFTWTRPD